MRLLAERLSEVQSALDIATGGCEVVLQRAPCRWAFDEVGALMWIWRKCGWGAPVFAVAKYAARLGALSAQLRRGEPFVAYSPASQSRDHPRTASHVRIVYHHAL